MPCGFGGSPGNGGPGGHRGTLHRTSAGGGWETAVRGSGSSGRGVDHGVDKPLCHMCTWLLSLYPVRIQVIKYITHPVPHRAVYLHIRDTPAHGSGFFYRARLDLEHLAELLGVD